MMWTAGYNVLPVTAADFAPTSTVLVNCDFAAAGLSAAVFAEAALSADLTAAVAFTSANLARFAPVTTRTF